MHHQLRRGPDFNASSTQRELTGSNDTEGFIHRSLKEVTCTDVEVTPLASFVSDLSTLSSQGTTARNSDFATKWDEYMKNVTLVYQMGTWVPKSFSTKELLHLDSFEVFLASFRGTQLSFRPQASASRWPLTFSEMLQHNFWQEFYETMGGKAMDFVMKQCLILFEKEDKFYLMLCSPSCFLGQRISKYQFKPKANNTRAQKEEIHEERTGDFRNPYRVPPFQQQMNPWQARRAAICKANELESSSRIIDSSQESSIPNSNPLKRPRTSKDSDSGIYEISRGKKRKNFDSAWNVEKMSVNETTKRIKVETPASNIPFALPQIGVVTLPCKKCKPECTAPTGLIRWFMPSRSVLESIISERRQLKLNLGYSVRTSGSKSSLSRQTQLNFVGIFESEAFVSKFNYGQDTILKSTVNLEPPYCTLPTCWSGIDLRRTTAEDLLGRGISVSVTVYKLSDYLARKLNIRVNKRYRTRKTKLPSTHDGTSDYKICTPQPSKRCANSKLYDPLLTLNTWTVFYSKSNAFDWPSNHIVTTVQSSSSVKEACEAVMLSIYQTEIGVSIVKDTPPTIPGLLTGVKKFVVFHQQVKNIHRYIREKVEFWSRKRCSNLQVKKILAERKLAKRRITSKRIPMSADTNYCSHSDYSDTDSIQLDNKLLLGTKNSSKICHESFNGEPKQSFAPGRIAHPIHSSCVLMTLKQLCLACGIADLLGSRRNFRGLFKFLRKAIVLAGTRSSLHLGQLMSLLDLNPKGVSWASDTVDYKVTLFAQVVLWVFNEFILVLLKMGFYITEGSDTRKHSVFFLKQKWRSMVDKVKDKYLRCNTLKIKKNSEGNTNLSGMLASLRFVPKKNLTLRPILSRRRSVAPYQRKLWKSMLSYFVNRTSPHRIKDPNSIRKRWSVFLNHWRDLGKPFLFFVKMDIQDAYPSVLMEELCKLVNETASLSPRMIKKEFRIISNSRVAYKQSVTPVESMDEWDSVIKSRPCIVQQTSENDQPLVTADEFSKMLFNLKQNDINIGRQQYDFQNGLPQGWALSEVLCNLYYGKLDSVYLKSFLCDQSEFLTTSVDDYLFISPSPLRVAAFVDSFSTGLKAFHSKLNSKKLNSNLWPNNSTSVPSIPCSTIGLSGNSYCLSCGHIRRDFSGYAGQDISSTITFNMNSFNRPEKFLIGRMKSMLALRLSAILVDPQINCRARIAANIFEMALFLGFRFYAICRVIYPSLRVFQDKEVSESAVQALKSCARSYNSMVMGLMRTAYSTMPDRICWTDSHVTNCSCMESETHKQITNISSPQNPDPMNLHGASLTRGEVFFLTYSAFITKLNKHSEPFRNYVLPSVHRLRKSIYYDLTVSQRVWLQSIVGKFEFVLPGEFAKINI